MERPKNLSAKYIASLGVLLALTLVFALIENMFPPIIPAMPYARVGFSNIVLLMALMLLGYFPCILILVLKCVFIGIFSGNMFSLVYSVPAGLIAYTLTNVILNYSKFSITAISVISSIAHNMVQLLVATIVIGKSVWLLSPYLLLLGSLSGLGVGIIVFYLLKSIPTAFLYRIGISD